MVSFRGKIGNYALAYPKADAPGLEDFTESAASSSDENRHFPGDESKGNKSSLRHRFKQTLNVRKSCSALRPTEYDTAYDNAQSHQGSVIRKSFSSLSSSLRQRFSSDETSSSENQSRQASVIRKSFGSMSSSLRGIRSMGSRSSQDKERRPATTRCRSFYEAAELVGSPIVHPDHLGFDSACNVVTWDDWDDSVPQLPELDDIITCGWTEDMIPEDVPPNTLANLSIFGRLDDPLTTAWNDEMIGVDDEPTVTQPVSVVERLPIRLKRFSTRPEQDTRPEATEGTRRSFYLGHINGNLKGAPESSKVPVEWLDTILETSVALRTDIFEVLRPGLETEEELLQRRSKRVYVFVPDENDHGKPWPKICYPDLKTALTDLYTRFRPYYANFAAYTSAIRTVQLFPSDFKIPDNKTPLPGSVIFNIREALVNWDAPSQPHSLREEDNKREDVKVTEMTVEAGKGPGLNTSRNCSPLCG